MFKLIINDAAWCCCTPNPAYDWFAGIGWKWNTCFYSSSVNTYKRICILNYHISYVYVKWVTLKWVFRVCTYLSLYIYARNSMRNTLEQTELIYWRAWLKWGRGVCEPKVSIAIFGFLPICNQILFINCVSKDLISQRRKISRTVCVYYDVRCMRLEYRIKISKQNMQIGWAHTHPPTSSGWG